VFLQFWALELVRTLKIVRKDLHKHRLCTVSFVRPQEASVVDPSLIDLYKPIAAVQQGNQSFFGDGGDTVNILAPSPAIPS
jgi:hypothetical protein